MLAALSAHLKSAGEYSAITIVRITGINRTTEELRLPAQVLRIDGSRVRHQRDCHLAAGRLPAVASVAGVVK
jgi:hypothetical protein